MTPQNRLTESLMQIIDAIEEQIENHKADRNLGMKGDSVAQLSELAQDVADIAGARKCEECGFFALKLCEQGRCESCQRIGKSDEPDEHGLFERMTDFIDNN